MSSTHRPRPGTIGWIDLTVPDAVKVRDFYQAVTGWRAEPVEMDGYDDFNMLPRDAGEPVAGVCHARGSNAELPAQWLVYIVVEDIMRSIERCRELGGKLIGEMRGSAEHGRFCVIRDPAGAVCALYQPAPA